MQTVLPLRSFGGVLISMTARGPLWHPRQVLVVHDFFVIEHPEWFSRRYQLSHAPLQRFQMATAGALVAVSEPVAEQLRRSGGRAPVTVAPNAPSAVFSAVAGEGTVLTERGLAQGGYLVTVGSLEPRKNLQRLADAYAALPVEWRRAHTLVIVGGSAEIFGAAEFSLPEGAQLAGYVSDDELRALYAGAGAVVFVSLAEGFGLPIVEAAAAGTTQFVLSDIEVFRWIAGDGAVFVDPEDVAAITAAMAAVIDAPESTDLVDIGRFDWELSAAAVRDAAEGLANARK